MWWRPEGTPNPIDTTWPQSVQTTKAGGWIIDVGVLRSEINE